MTNALRHTPAATPITVTVRRGPERSSVRVRDRGSGLGPDALEHVFERFWQADPSRAGAGTGLGLAIVQAVASEHGGTVTAENAPGGGAAFTLTIPNASHALPGSSAEEPEVDRAR